MLNTAIRSILALSVPLVLLFSGSSHHSPEASQQVPTAALPSAKPLGPVELEYEQALSVPDNEFEVAFEKLKRVLPQFGGDYVTEGDLLRSEQQLKDDLLAARRDRVRRQKGQPPQMPIGPELISALKPDGSVDLWERGKRTITYAVDRKSFPTAEQAATVVEQMKNATARWEAACKPERKCEVDFVFNDTPAPSHATSTFIVRFVNAGGRFIAAAFFPSYPADRRFLNIDPSFFTTNYNQTGVLRHELGHVLGYRHEHIRDIQGCRLEGTQWKPITPYDPHSVMHYLCGGGGTLALELTSLDEQGHVKTYGVQ